MKTKLHNSFCKNANNYQYLFNNYYYGHGVAGDKFSFIHDHDRKYIDYFLQMNLKTNELKLLFSVTNDYEIGKELRLNDYDYLHYQWEEMIEEYPLVK